MVKLFCALVGVKGNAFSVTIDSNESVDDLKKAIKKENKKTITCDARELELYLAKKGDAWLTENEVKHVTDTSGLNHLKAARSKLRKVGLSDDEVGEMEVDEDDETAGNGPVNVLVVVPESATTEEQQPVTMKNFHELRRDIVEVKEALASLPHKKSKSYSDAALGQIELARLEKDELIIDATPIENGEAFWSEEIQIQADAITNEAVFDAFITPFFNTILHGCDLKPDGFATHRGMFRVKPVPDDGVQRPNGFRFGVAEEELFDCLVLFESKLTITQAAFGQVARYLQNLCPEASASAVLFDRRSFWLIKSYKSVVVKVQKAMWASKGSKSLFQNFITDNISPWVARLTLACSCLGVDVVEGDAFLGRGAYGRVFKVIGQDGEVFALKIVEKCSVRRLYQEEKALTKAQGTSLTISPVGKLIETPESAALLLSPVGKPLPRPTTRQEVQNLFGLLWQLHANGLVHGDPRVPNVILNGEKLLWIDLVEVMEASPTLKQLDAEILTRSILSVSRTVLLDPSLNQLIDNYGKSATRENLNHLVEVVCQSLVPN